MDRKVVDLVHRVRGALVALADDTAIFPCLAVVVAENVSLGPRSRPQIATVYFQAMNLGVA